MKRYLYTIAVSFIVPALMHAQPLIKAQKQMDKYNYAVAIEILKKAVENEKTYTAAIPMLAECYRMQHDVLNARATYAKAAALPDAKPEYIFFYARALQSSGNYTKAREMFQKYADQNPSDPKGKLFEAYCDSVLGPWKGKTHEYEVKVVNAINTGESDFGPAIYEGDLVFASDNISDKLIAKKYGWTGHGFLNIMKSSPEKTGDLWGAMEVPTSFDSRLNQEYHEGPACFSADAKTIYFTRSFYGRAKREDNYKTNLLKIYYATRDNGSWGEAKPFYLNSKDFSVGHPALSPDGQTLYFVSDMPGGQGGTDLWMCKREGDAWGAPANLGSMVNTSENEMFPTMSPEGVLYFSSEGHAGYGALDIFRTRFENGSWTTPENLHPPLNSSFDDFAVAFAPGEKNGFFSSNRPGGMGSDDIYAFRTIKPLVPVLPAFIAGLVKDKTTLQPLAGATVFLYDKGTGMVKILKTDSTGLYKATVTKPADFIVKAMLPEYIADCNPFIIDTLKPGITQNAPRDLLLDKLAISKTFHIDNIYYDFDKYTIRTDARPELDNLVKIMNENAINVELGSHTDCRGSFAYNDKLSQNRAEAAVEYIINAGIDKSRITAKGYGEHQLTNQCSDGIYCTPAEHQANRRTEFKVISLTKPQVVPDQFEPGSYIEGQELNVKMLAPAFFDKCK